MRTRWMIWVGCGLLLASAATLAALTPEQAREAQKLIRDFTAAEFATRQAAVEKLVAMGPDVLPLVEAARGETQDAEVRMRCEMVLKALAKLRPAPPAPAGDALPVEGLDGTRVTLDVQDRPISEAVLLIAGKSGSRPFILTLGYGIKKDRPVTFATKDAPFWDAMDAFCRAAGLTYSGMGQEEGIAYSLRDAPKEDVADPRACSGAAVVRVLRVERGGAPPKFVSFRADDWFGKQDPNNKGFNDPGKLRIVLRSGVENRYALLETWMEITRATQAGGRELVVNNRDDGMRRTSRPRWYTSGTGFGFDLRLDAPDDLSGPLAVEGVVHAVFGVGRREVKFEDVFADGDRRVEQDDLDVEIASARLSKNAASFALNVRRAGPDDALLAWLVPKELGFTLVDAQGNEYRRFGGHSSGGNRRVGFDITGVKPAEGAWTLRYACPARVVRKDYPFKIEGIAVP